MSLVSIVIPTFNGESTIAETLMSVLTQEDADIEVLVSDQNSSDGTRKILEEFTSDPRVRVFDGPSDGGAQANWNFVTSLAKGDYIKLVCHDDLLLPGLISRQVRLLDSNPTAVMTACKRDVIAPSGRALFRARGLQGLNDRVSGTEAIKQSMRMGTNIFGEPACVLFRTEALKESGNWDGRWSYLIDLASYARVLMGGGFVSDQEVGVKFRVSIQQWSANLRRTQSREFRQFMRGFYDAAPQLFTYSDLLLGRSRSYFNELMRRAVYLWVSVSGGRSGRDG